MPITQNPVEVFYSYAHADKRWLKRLDTHLSLLKRQGLISTWHDRLLVPGTDWSQELDIHLNSASVILLLISPDFLASDYCYGIEMQRALERDQAREARVIPILLRPVDWKDAPFAHLQALPTEAKPITTWSNRDTAFADVAAGIRRAIEDLSQLATSLPQSDFPSTWNVPFPRNPFFTGREDLLTHLHTQLQAGQPAALSQPQAISGLGGIGKTQIAVEYVYRFRQDYQAVFWAHAEDTQELNASYTTIATLLNLPEKDAPEQTRIVQAVKTWLQMHRGWLLILDNADEPDLLLPFLPPALGGNLLLTTRATALGSLAHRLEVETFTPTLGALFLLRRAGIIAADAEFSQATAQDQALAAQIVQELGRLPLALDQAGAYIETTTCSLATYQRLYQQRAGDLLKEYHGLPSNHPPVAATWSLAFQKVEEKSPVAAELLQFCAFLAADAIPEEIFTRGVSKLEIQLATTTDEYQLNQIIEILRAYSLITRDPVKTTLTMHRLVQEVLRNVLSPEAQRKWMQQVVLAINTTFPYNIEVEEWPVCERLLPHALLCEKWIEQAHIVSNDSARLLHQTAFYLQERARYEKVEPLYQRALAIIESVSGREHPNTANTLNNLATFYQTQGKYEEAEPLYQRARAIFERVFGPEHSNTANSFNNLGNLYRTQGRYKEAELYYQRALAIRDSVLGREHPTTALNLNNLAGLYWDQGKYLEAESFLLQALVIYGQILGPEHPDTARSLNNLAALYWDQGKYEEAEPFYLRALAIHEQVLGSEHPDTVLILSNLAALYRMQGKYEEALPMYQRALAIHEQVLGSEHPETGASLNSLAGLYDAQGNYEKAEPLFRRALAIRERTLGLDHPDTATSLNNLAALYDAQGNHEKAEPLFRQALAIRERILGLDHPDTANSLNNLGYLCWAQGKYEEAALFYQQALAIFERVLGPEHPDTASGLNNLAGLYDTQGKYEEAEPLLQRALAICEHVLGSEHPDTAQSLNNLAGLYEAQGRYEEAEPLLQQALAICERVRGPDHSDTQIIRANYQRLLGMK